jgi:multicomponent K+:H+ antiporter subunit E
MAFFRRVVPAPLLSAVLLLLWFVLARSTQISDVLPALAFALAAPLMTSKLRLTNVRVRRPFAALRYIGTVGRDVLVSGVQVGLDVIAWRRRRPHSQFVVVPLDLRAPVGLALLSMVTTVVPGTVWSELALDRSALLLHVWDVDDEAGFITRYKDRYERPLREIFE